MTDLENLQRQEHLYAVAEEERFDKMCEQILALFIQLSPAHQHDLLEKLRDDFAIDLSEDEANPWVENARANVAIAQAHTAQKTGTPIAE